MDRPYGRGAMANHGVSGTCTPGCYNDIGTGRVTWQRCPCRDACRMGRGANSGKEGLVCQTLTLAWDGSAVVVQERSSKEELLQGNKGSSQVQ